MKINLLFAGLKGSGKTTSALKTLGRLDIQSEIGSTAGVVEWSKVEYNNVIYDLWESGVGTGFNLFLPGRQVHGLIYVVDSSIRANIEQARQYLMKLLQQRKFDILPLQVLANKQDLSDVMTVEEITDKLGLRGLENHRWNVKATIAINEAGQYDALEWLSTQIQRIDTN